MSFPSIPLSPRAVWRMGLRPLNAATSALSDGVAGLYGRGDVAGFLFACWRAILALTLICPVHWYHALLETDADAGKWQRLPEGLVAIIAPHYRTDLTRVRVAHGVDTFIDACLTLGDDVFINYSLSLSRNTHDVHLLLHELRHVDQFRESSYEHFLLLYLLDALVTGCRTRSLDPHDDMEFEKDAEGHADALLLRPDTHQALLHAGFIASRGRSGSGGRSGRSRTPARRRQGGKGRG
jgi:Domain of unknown function (DUF4157)